jgi:regulator of sigma D
LKIKNRIPSSGGKMTEAEAIQLHKVLETKTAELMEHFDTVQIVVTRHNRLDETTEMMSKGRGNLYARFSSVEAWLETIE